MHFNNRFSTYKNINIGRTAVVFGSGPTLNLFDSKIIPEKDALFVGVNSLVFKKDITLDYYFCGHDSAREPHHLHHITLENTLKEQIISSKINRQIFCATHVDGRQHPLHFDFKDVVDMNAIPYSIHTGKGLQTIKKEIHENDLYNHSIVFSALQFILYTGVEKIYLVGCDGGGGFSFLHPGKVWRDRIDWCWQEFSEFIKKEYDNVEVVSINPRLLEGLFHKDIWSLR